MGQEEKERGRGRRGRNRRCCGAGGSGIRTESLQRKMQFKDNHRCWW